MPPLSHALVLIAALLAQADPERYHWPLELPRVLTSSFAEYRPGRFHMGIDLRTGPIGQNVFAAGDGYVSRVRCSPYGYGKAIYLQLHDGNSVVYGHLDDYSPELRAYVRAAQHRREDYTVDLYPEPGQFPVTRGQFIAKSGQTGIGVPHLHYEFRDASGAPISPRLLGIDWPDTTRPVFRKAAVVPHGPDTYVNGDMLPVILDVQNTGAGQSRTALVRARGTVGFAVDVIDPANGGSTRLGVHVVETTAGGAPLFRIVHDRVSYSHQNDGGVAYHPYLTDHGRFLVQWRWPGNRTDIYNAVTTTGWYDVPESAQDITITAADFHGNAATLTIPLEFSAPLEPLDAVAPETLGQGRVTFDTFGEHLVVTAAFTTPEPDAPRLNVFDRQVEMDRIDASTFRFAVPPNEGGFVRLTVVQPRISAPTETFYVVRPGAGTAIEHGGARLEIPPDAAYGALHVQLRGRDSARTSALTPVGGAVELWPPNAPLDARVRLSLPIPPGYEANNRLLIYQRRGARWNALSTAREAGRLIASTGSFGTFAIMEDTAAPVITVEAPAPGSLLATRRPNIRAAIHDAGSGIASFRVTANGAWLLAEYDPEENRLVWEQDEDLPVGPLELVFHVTDEAGNAARRVVAATLADPENAAAAR